MFLNEIVYICLCIDVWEVITEYFAMGLEICAESSTNSADF